MPGFLILEFQDAENEDSNMTPRSSRGSCSTSIDPFQSAGGQRQRQREPLEPLSGLETAQSDGARRSDTAGMGNDDVDENRRAG